MYITNLTRCLTLTVILHYYLEKSCKFQIHAIGKPSDVSLGVYTLAIRKKVYAES